MNLLLSILIPLCGYYPTDTISVDTVGIQAPIKTSSSLQEEPVASTSFSLSQIDNLQISSVKDVSATAPNFFQPKYGSRITSTIYIRGFGSRIDQPAVGLMIDNVPIMNKNAFDFDFFDIRRIDVLRGPQGTLYGRNSNGGIMNIYTLSPMVWQGLRIKTEFDSEFSTKASVSYYSKPKDNFGYSVAAAASYNEGFFTNEYSGEQCDGGSSYSGRVKLHWLPNTRWSVENSTSVNYVDEGGYAYHQTDAYDLYIYDILPISYNDECGYQRFTLIDGLVAKRTGKRADLALVTSYQFLSDDLLLDNDFTSWSYFTLHQIQREHNVTQEVLLARHDKSKQWQWTTGMFAFGKMLNIESPVTFKRDGIEQLILKNANKGLHSTFPNNNLEIADSSFVIACDLAIPTYGAALYHESHWKIKHWKLTAGIRADFEYSQMDYNESCDVDYRFDLTMTNYKNIRSEFVGTEKLSSLELLPKISAQYFFNSGSVYATFANGYKAGGFNTQIFSDIMQPIMMNSIMDDLGVSFSSESAGAQSAAATTYKPETNYNFEVGAKYQKKSFAGTLALFWIEGVDQQITVLPEGNGVGRKMSNAGRTRSRGVECSAHYTLHNWSFSADCGFTDACYRNYQYNDTVNYAGNHVPYAPTSTIAAQAKYVWNVSRKLVDNVHFSLQYRGIGKIYWNDDNSLSQPLYSLFSAQIQCKKDNFTFGLFCKNLTDTQYYTFYFKSIGRSFYAEGTPRVIGINCNLTI